jgi:sugar/nucleoside kinase (ribokinase family)
MTDPTSQERRLLEELRDDPFLSQRDLADRLGISRSTVASHIQALQAKGYIEGRAYILHTPEDAILCVGGINSDVTFRLAAPLITGTSNIGTSTETPGGVARNVAEAMSSIGTRVFLAGVVGDDGRGRVVIKATSRAGVNCSAVVSQAGSSTGTYTAVIDPEGDLVVGLNDMRILDDSAWEDIRPPASIFGQIAWIFLDANLPPDVVRSAIAEAEKTGIPIAADAVSIQKADRIAEFRFDLVFCNVEEAAVLLDRKTVQPDEAAQLLVGRGHKAAVVTHGAEGASWANTEESGHCPAIAVIHGDVTGAGDSLIAGTLSGLAQGESLHEAVTLGTQLAAQALNRVGASHSTPDIPSAHNSPSSTQKETS